MDKQCECNESQYNTHLKLLTSMNIPRDIPEPTRVHTYIPTKLYFMYCMHYMYYMYCMYVRTIVGACVDCNRLRIWSHAIKVLDGNFDLVVCFWSEPAEEDWSDWCVKLSQSAVDPHMQSNHHINPILNIERHTGAVDDSGGDE